MTPMWRSSKLAKVKTFAIPCGELGQDQSGFR